MQNADFDMDNENSMCKQAHAPFIRHYHLFMHAAIPLAQQ
jgi:hypothetical protein